MDDKLLIDNDGYKYLFKEQDLHTKDGVIKAETIRKAKAGTKVETNKGVPLTVLDAAFLDKYWKIKRGAQIIPLKDLGFIAAEVGIAPDWVIVDAGAGSGGAACFFAHLCSAGHVYTYDIRDDHLKIVEKNIAFLDLKNITVQKHDITTGIPQKDVDMVLLDIAEPWKAVDAAHTALHSGRYLISYSPTIPQVMDFVAKVQETHGFLYLKTCEIAEKEWDVLGRKVRPKSQSIGHSGFLSFVRKI